MKEQLTTPSCEVTGLPLPIRLSEPPNGARFNFHDYHHHFHPAKELRASLSGKALRYSRGQDVPRALHDRYHDIFSGPAVPDEESAHFKLTILACAGVVPNKVIDLSRPREFQIKTATKQEHQHFVEQNTIHIEQPNRIDNQTKIKNTIGKFIVCYALKQNLSDVISERVVEEFLETNNAIERKKELGNYILREVVGVALEPVIQAHNTAKEEGLAPASAKRRKIKQLTRLFFPSYRLADYHDEVAERLQVSLGAT